MNRAEHNNSIKEIIELLRNNLQNMSNLDDLKQIEENLGLYKRNIEDDEFEIRTKDGKVNESQNESHLLRLEVDQTRNARSDNDAEKLKINDYRIAYDGIWQDNHKLNGENQALHTNMCSVSADLREVNERRNAITESSPERGV